MLIRRDRAMAAVTIVLDVAFHGGRSSTVSAADLAERLGMARRGMEPLMQALSRAGVLESLRGPHGGYRLGGPRRDITIAAIVAAVTAGEEPAADQPASPLQEAVVEPVWAQLEAAARGQLGQLTVEALLRRAAAEGLQRPASEPISFSI